MGCMWSVKLPRLPADVSYEQLGDSIRALLTRLNAQMSNYQSDSELSRFNQSQSTEWFAISVELAEVVLLALQVARETSGAFDITVEPIVSLWGFGPRTAPPRDEIPSDEAISAALARVGYRQLEVRTSPPALRKRRPDVSIDLGGIGKGYAVDQIARLLESHKIKDYLIAVGGELRASGNSTVDRPWCVGIETPTPGVRRILEHFDLNNSALSTSGDYRNFLEIDGRRYCHEIDPRTGRPIVSSLAAVSVVHSSNAYADAMATALMILGSEEGYELVCRLKLSAVFITRGGQKFETRFTPHFNRTLVRANLL